MTKDTLIFRQGNVRVAELDIARGDQGYVVVGRFIPAHDEIKQSCRTIYEAIDSVEAAVKLHFSEGPPDRIELQRVPEIIEFADLSRFALPVLLISEKSV